MIVPSGGGRIYDCALRRWVGSLIRVLIMPSGGGQVYGCALRKWVGSMIMVVGLDHALM